MENNEDIELMLFQLKEGLLSDEEARKATLFLQQHPEWQEVADLYDPMLKAPSYPAAEFPDKEILHKPLITTATATSRAIVLRRLSIAASILVAVAIATRILLIPNAKEDGTTIVAENRQNKDTDYFSQKTSPSDVLEDEMSAASESRQGSLQATATKTPAMSAQQEKRIAPAEQATTEQAPAEQVPTIKVTITDKLIAYLDDAEPDIPETPSINITDKLIAYLPADTPATAPAESAPRPKWTYAIEDLWNGVQLAYTERQNEIIDIFTNKN